MAGYMELCLIMIKFMSWEYIWYIIPIAVILGYIPASIIMNRFMDWRDERRLDIDRNPWPVYNHTTD